MCSIISFIRLTDHVLFFITGTDHDTEAEKQLENVEDDSKDFGASLVIGCLLIIPVVIIVIATIYVRVRKTGKKHLNAKANSLGYEFV